MRTCSATISVSTSGGILSKQRRRRPCSLIYTIQIRVHTPFLPSLIRESCKKVYFLKWLCHQDGRGGVKGPAIKEKITLKKTLQEEKKFRQPLSSREGGGGFDGTAIKERNFLLRLPLLKEGETLQKKKTKICIVYYVYCLNKIPFSAFFTKQYFRISRCVCD